jgi:hypothetical protein
MTAVLERSHVRAEGGGWVALRCAVPELADRTPTELLEAARSLPGNLRYVSAGAVELLGEFRCVCNSATFDEARRRLHAWRDGVTSDEPITAEALEAALESSGFGWARREQGWAVPAGEALAREIAVHAEPGGVRLEAVLADWDEIDDVSRTGLAAFLLAAQANLRGVRCHLEGGRALVVVRAEADHLETDIPSGLHAITTACRLLAREAAALLSPATARAYLAYREIRAARGR